LPSATADALSGTRLSPLVVNLEQLSAVASMQEGQLARIATALPKAAVLRVPFLSRDVADLGALAEVADYLA
jgi:ABC-type hemin transport system ATPase subunit